VKGKDKHNAHGNFDWFGHGTLSNVYNGDVVPSNYVDTKENMEILSSESD
jgi:hypothetical protein